MVNGRLVVYRSAMHVLTFLLAFLLTLPAAAQTVTPWQGNARASARLIADPGLREGVYHTGVEIRLGPKTVTYWRDPGEAGVPPQFDFTGSVNVAKADVLYPAPKRIAEAGGVEAFGYEDGVIFPVLVTPIDPALPAHLEMAVKYAACDKICVPAEVTDALDLLPTGDTALLPKLAEMEALVPKVVALAQSGLRILATSNSDNAMWRISIAPARLPATDLFVEGPEGWSFDVKNTGEPGQFEMMVVSHPKTPGSAQIPVRLTFVAQSGAIEVETKLDKVVW